MKNILVTGGAGYIGSHMVKMLFESGHNVTVLDNLSTGFRDSVLYGDFILCDLNNQDYLNDIFKRSSFDVVMHFASSIQVGESINDPLKYYNNNIANSINLLKAMNENGVRNFIFSSSAAIFGNPIEPFISESHKKDPINPYGYSKLVIENILRDAFLAYGINSVSLRYFNAAGADSTGCLGERHEPETHLIPLLLQVASGKRSSIDIFGIDYPTPDGTCIRDFIHVEDICNAHLLCIHKLENSHGALAYNLGNGNGFSVKEVIETVQQVTGKLLNLEFKGRRTGDPSILVADSSFARSDLQWTPKFPSLLKIVEHAWRWECSKSSI